MRPVTAFLSGAVTWMAAIQSRPLAKANSQSPPQSESVLAASQTTAINSIISTQMSRDALYIGVISVATSKTILLSVAQMLHKLTPARKSWFYSSLFLSTKSVTHLVPGIFHLRASGYLGCSVEKVCETTVVCRHIYPCHKSVSAEYHTQFWNRHVVLVVYFPLS